MDAGYFESFTSSSFLTTLHITHSNHFKSSNLATIHISIATMVSFKNILLFAGLAMAAPTPDSEKSLTKRFNGGWCGVHIHLFNGENPQGSHEMNVFVYDGKQQLVWSKESIWGNGILMTESENLPAVLNINTYGGGALVSSLGFYFCWKLWTDMYKRPPSPTATRIGILMRSLAAPSELGTALHLAPALRPLKWTVVSLAEQMSWLVMPFDFPVPGANM
jgi:hypothetical protein